MPYHPVKDCALCGHLFNPKRAESLICRGCNDTHNLRKRAFQAYGEACSCCGEAKYEFLSIDSPPGVGRAKTLYLWLLRHDYPQDMGLRVLCQNCRGAQGLYGYCPHESPLLAR